MLPVRGQLFPTRGIRAPGSARFDSSILADHVRFRVQWKEEERLESAHLLRTCQGGVPMVSYSICEK